MKKHEVYIRKRAITKLEPGDESNDIQKEE